MSSTAAFILAIGLACTACNDQIKTNEPMLQPPLSDGQTLDPESLYAKTWPGQPALVKLKDNLILSIPPQFHQFWAHRDHITGKDLSIRPPFPVKDLHYAKSAGFTMHMPDFEGYRPDNYLNEFDENRVLVAYISPENMSAIEPDAPGAYPPNMFKRISTGQYRSFDPDKYEEKFGLRCYNQMPRDDDRQNCYGRRDSEIEEYILLKIYTPPYAPGTVFPLMSAKYFTPRYGGVEIAWRAHMKNFPHWREIDAQIWKYIDAWNIAPKIATVPAIPTSVNR